MAHDKVYAVCENKCFVETKTKEQINDDVETLNTSIETLNTSIDTVNTSVNNLAGKFNVITVPADSEETEVELGTDLPFMTEVINLKSASVTVRFTKPEDAESVELKFAYIKSGNALTEVSQTVTTSYTLTLETGKRLIIYGNV